MAYRKKIKQPELFDPVEMTKNSAEITANSVPLDMIQRGIANSRNPKLMADRVNNLSHGASNTEIIENQKDNNIKIHHSSESVDIVLTLFFQNTKQLPQPAKKLLRFIMTKMPEQAFFNKKLERPFVTFNLQDIVDAGIYKTIESARTGFKTGSRALIDLAIEGEVKSKNGKEKNYRWSYGHLFRKAVIDKNVCCVLLEVSNDWNFIINTYQLIPSYCYRLSNRTYDLTEAIFYYARVNAKKIAEDGFFTMSLNLVAERMALPEESVNPTRDIKNPILDAVKELNEEENKRSKKGFSIEFEDDSNKAIKDWLNTGKLKVFFYGDYLAKYTRNANCRELKIKKCITTKEQADLLENQFNEALSEPEITIE